ncbi:MAG: hypothetical protein A2X08_08895 [Bacteroidetes bacterium GWA2_32_17]|nr:MAG: hypothetical protein A2X08_08895 [Bacteroidetes bacterium GWA2_32_17]
MDEKRNCVLSIAGFDPSGGAGILADIKTFERHRVYGVSAISSVTFQNDIEFNSIQWINADDIIKQVSLLRKRFEFSIIKIGLIKDLESLEKIINYLTSSISNPIIIWDPIIKASAGFEFHNKFQNKDLLVVIKNIFLISPNVEEIIFITNNNDPKKASKELSRYCNVLLKGGHNEMEPGIDYLYIKNNVEKILPAKENIFPKHGSGCVLSSAIAANLALGFDLLTSCYNAKNYVETFLSSNRSLIGYHYV